MMTFEEANTLLKRERKDMRECDQIWIGVRAFGCTFEDNICRVCVHFSECMMESMRCGYNITKCKYFLEEE